MLRVTSQNINGFLSNNLPMEIEQFHHYEHSIRAGIALCQETNVDWKKQNVKELCEQTGRVLHTNITITTSCNDVPAEKIYLPGGTMMFSAGPVQNRLICQATDPTGMGRFAYQTLRGKDDLKIAFITAYRVCDQNIETAGSLTSYFQQWHTLRRQGHKAPNPRKQMLRDLQSTIIGLIMDGHDICLGFDANEALDNETQQLQIFAEECGLVSVHENLYDDDYYRENPIPPTHQRGSTKIDHILCTPRLSGCIKSVSILAHHVGFHSDHRCLIVDFDMNRIFGCGLPTIVRQPDRILKTTDPKTAKKYRNYLHKFLESRNVYEQVRRLKSKMERVKTSGRMHREAEELDKYITLCMIKAEHKSAWKSSNSFSPIKLKAGKIIQYWKMALSAIKNNQSVPTEAMLKIIEYYGDEDLLQTDNIEIVTEQLKESTKQYRDIQKRSKEIRQQFLEERAEMEERKGNISKAAAIKRILNSEFAKKLFAGLRRVMKRSRHQGAISMIKIPNPLGHESAYVNVTNPEEIEQYLLERNRNHYAQAQGTPFTTELRDLIGLTGTSDFSTAILHGTANLQTLSPAVQAIFRQLRRYNKVGIDNQITCEDLRAALDRWKEQTTSSPSGRHLGHYKSLLVNIGDDTDSLATNIFEMHCNMINIAQKRKQPFERWKKEVEIMLEKDEGDPKIHRLRIICLYEADYNIYLKILWAHRLVKQAETNHMFGEAQGGGQPYRTSHDVALRKMLTYTYARATRINFGFMDLDATSCFDRIIAGFAMLCSRHYGMPYEACELHGVTIAKMQHHVRTALGISNAFFESTPEKMIYGSGQGSCGSPPLWLVCSDVLFKSLEQLVGIGMRFTSPSGHILDTRTTDALVDDATNGINDGDTTNGVSEMILMERLTQQAIAWEQLLHTSGGKLELPKCLIYLIIHDFSNGEPTMRSKESIISRLHLQCSQTKTTSEITLLDPKQSHKTLGTLQNPIGDPKEQMAVIRDKEKLMSSAFSSMYRRPQYQIKRAYQMYKSIVQYPLNCSLMTYKEANSLLQRSTRAIIGAFRVNRSFP